VKGIKIVSFKITYCMYVHTLPKLQKLLSQSCGERKKGSGMECKNKQISDNQVSNVVWISNNSVLPVPI